MSRAVPSSAALALLGIVLVASGCRRTVPSPADPERIDPPALPGALGASLSDVAGIPVLSWLEPAERERWRLRVSRFGDNSWSAPVTVTEGDDLLANWADFPAVGSNGSAAVAHWLVQDPTEGEAYSIALAGSGDGGTTWRALGRLPADASAAEHGFVSWLPEGAAGSGLRAFWLDGSGMPGGGPMTLRSALVDPARGASGEELLDERVCDCCQTDAAMTADGPVVVYRDRSADEIRDIAIRRRTPAGWSAPALVHADGWHIEGCPVNGPAVAASDRRVAVAWFTGAPSPRVLLAFSEDSGATFAPPVPLDTDQPLGRIDLALDRQGAAIVSWLGREPGASGRSALRLQRVAPSGPSGPALTVATTAATGGSRASGFPRLLLDDDGHLLIAWTEPGSPGRLRAARVAFDRLAQAAP
ncbi:MAG TPA: hypothetical protein VN851_08335 [Thermoanaerobaculia bacterium]|nr:hypothetical protein [Thermoanaerobaculia bacterium]